MKNLINSFAEVKLLKENDILSVKFFGFVPFDEFKKILEYEYKFIRYHRIKKCLIDLRFISLYDKGSKEHVKDVWFPHVKSLGIRQVAFIAPKDALGQLAMKSAHKDAESETALTIKHFKKTEEAIEWLKTC